MAQLLYAMYELMTNDITNYFQPMNLKERFMVYLSGPFLWFAFKKLSLNFQKSLHSPIWNKKVNSLTSHLCNWWRGWWRFFRSRRKSPRFSIFVVVHHFRSEWRRLWRLWRLWRSFVEEHVGSQRRSVLQSESRCVVEKTEKRKSLCDK